MPTPDNTEQLIKSQQRVKNLGEVFTPRHIIDDMLDMLDTDIWQIHPSRTFLEPAAGDGNFLVAILERKVAVILDHHRNGTLPAGHGLDAVQFHLLQALASIYAVDISPENVIGSPDHPIGSRQRLVAALAHWRHEAVGTTPAANSRFIKSAQQIVTWNLLIGNMLPTNSDGTPSGRDDLPIIEYTWHPDALRVTLTALTLGDCLTPSHNTNTSPLDNTTPPARWTGSAFTLHRAEPLNSTTTAAALSPPPPSNTQ
jgi:hypothetical protein